MPARAGSCFPFRPRPDTAALTAPEPGARAPIEGSLSPGPGAGSHQKFWHDTC